MVRRSSNLLGQVLAEELGGLPWIKLFTHQRLISYSETFTAGRAAACQDAPCVFRALDGLPITRVLGLTISNPKRKVFILNAIVVGPDGRTQLRLSETEEGGPDELKYAIPGLVERLFAAATTPPGRLTIDPISHGRE